MISMKHTKTDLIKVILLSIFTVIFTFSGAFSVDMRLGAGGGITNNRHSVDFLQTQSSAAQGVKYQDVSSTEPQFFIYGETALFPFLDFRLGCGYTQIGAFMQSPERTTIQVIHLLQRVDREVEIIHNFDTDLTMISFNPAISIIPFRLFPFRFNIGYEMGFYTENRYYSFEKLSDKDITDGVKFLNQSDTRNEFNEEISESEYQGISASLSYDFRFFRNIIIRPEIGYVYHLNQASLGIGDPENRIPDLKDKISRITACISIAYDFNPPAKKEEVRIDTVIIEKFVPVETERVIPAEDPVLNEVNDDLSEKIYECCYLIFYSTQNKTEAEAALERIASEIEEEIYIDKWKNPDNEVVFFRVLSGCYSRVSEVFRIKQKTAHTLEKLKTGQTPVVKCY